MFASLLISEVNKGLLRQRTHKPWEAAIREDFVILTALWCKFLDPTEPRFVTLFAFKHVLSCVRVCVCVHVCVCICVSGGVCVGQNLGIVAQESSTLVFETRPPLCPRTY